MGFFVALTGYYEEILLYIVYLPKGGVDMTYDQIVDFITSKMKMFHIYQPLLNRSLVDAGGSATLRQLGQIFLSQDESQLFYYENHIKEMPLKVLFKHTVVSKEGELVHLNVKCITLEQMLIYVASVSRSYSSLSRNLNMGFGTIGDWTPTITNCKNE